MKTWVLQKKTERKINVDESAWLIESAMKRYTEWQVLVRMLR